MADRVGQHLGNYRLTRLLGKGGFAEVYLGEHVYLETQAAIKVLLTQLADEDMEPFRLEAKRVAHLEHPHIVRVLDFGVDGTTQYLVMSYAPNGTLRQRHPKGGLAEQSRDQEQHFQSDHQHDVLMNHAFHLGFAIQTSLQGGGRERDRCGDEQRAGAGVHHDDERPVE